MGKRELVLVLAFIVVGAVVYQITAPPLAPGQEGFSFGRLAQHVKQVVHGRPAHASAQSTRTDSVDASATEVRFNVGLLDLTILGEERTDVASQLTVDSNGIDDAEAQRLAKATKLLVDRAGAGLVFRVEFPKDGRQHGALTVRVPKRFLVRIDNPSRSGKLDVQHVASVDVRGNRGDSHLADIAGEIALVHRSGDLTIAGAGSLRLTASGAEAHVKDVRGPASIEVTSSNLEIVNVRGPLDIKSRGSDVSFRDVQTLEPPLRLDMQSGRLEIEGLQTETRIDGRGTEIRITMARAVPLTVYDTGDDISITTPPGGYTLDAVTTEGVLSIDEASTGVAVAKAADEREQRASGAIRGGGPTISLRNTRGDIAIRNPEGK
jgi:hypothetical protein